MAIKFQYNKTSLQQIEKALKMRQRTLPIIKSKETALRLEVKKCKAEADELERKLQSQIEGYEKMYALWGEFDASLVTLQDVEIDVKKVAGVRVPILKNIKLEAKPFGAVVPLFFSSRSSNVNGSPVASSPSASRTLPLNLYGLAVETTTIGRSS